MLEKKTFSLSQIFTKVAVSALLIAFFFLPVGPEIKAASNDSSIFGTIEEPAGVSQFNQDARDASGGTNNIGLLIFISNMIKLATAVAGLWVMFNFITAGFTYVTASGDKGAYDKIGTKLTLSVFGLVLIVGAYTIAGIIGLIIFGDATYIINPQIPSAI